MKRQRSWTEGMTKRPRLDEAEEDLVSLLSLPYELLRQILLIVVESGDKPEPAPHPFLFLPRSYSAYSEGGCKFLLKLERTSKFGFTKVIQELWKFAWGLGDSQFPDAITNFSLPQKVLAFSDKLEATKSGWDIKIMYLQCFRVLKQRNSILQDNNQDKYRREMVNCPLCMFLGEERPMVINGDGFAKCLICHLKLGVNYEWEAENCSGWRDNCKGSIKKYKDECIMCPRNGQLCKICRRSKMEKCPNCNRMACRDHNRRCHRCRDHYICDGCWRCSLCHKLPPDDKEYICADWDGTSCPCLKLPTLCGDCGGHLKCGRCGEANICEDHIKTCDTCLDPICSSCSGYCDVCEGTHCQNRDCHPCENVFPIRRCFPPPDLFPSVKPPWVDYGSRTVTFCYDGKPEDRDSGVKLIHQSNITNILDFDEILQICFGVVDLRPAPEPNIPIIDDDSKQIGLIKLD